MFDESGAEPSSHQRCKPRGERRHQRTAAGQALVVGIVLVLDDAPGRAIEHLLQRTRNRRKIVPLVRVAVDVRHSGYR